MGRLNDKNRERLRELFGDQLDRIVDPEDRESYTELEKRVFEALDAPERVEDNDPRVLTAVDEVAARIHRVRDVQEARKLSEIADLLDATVAHLHAEKTAKDKADKQNAALIHQMRRDKHATRMGRAALRFLAEAGKQAAGK
jgi:hypothetical protein